MDVPFTWATACTIFWQICLGLGGWWSVSLWTQPVMQPCTDLWFLVVTQMGNWMLYIVLYFVLWGTSCIADHWTWYAWHLGGWASTWTTIVFQSRWLTAEGLGQDCETFWPALSNFCLLSYISSCVFLSNAVLYATCSGFRRQLQI